MTKEILGNNQMHGTGSTTSFEEAICIIERLDVVIRMQKG